MGVRPRVIDLRIGELVLEGTAARDAERVGTATERELSRLLEERGLPPGMMVSGGREAIDAGAFPQAPLATPVLVGGLVAQMVYTGLGR